MAGAGGIEPPNGGIKISWLWSPVLRTQSSNGSGRLWSQLRARRSAIEWVADTRLGRSDLGNASPPSATTPPHAPALALMYFADLDPTSGSLHALKLVPLQIKNFRLSIPSRRDIEWIQQTLDRECQQFGTRVFLTPNCSLQLSGRGQRPNS